MIILNFVYLHLYIYICIESRRGLIGNMHNKLLNKLLVDYCNRWSISHSYVQWYYSTNNYQDSKDIDSKIAPSDTPITVGL